MVINASYKILTTHVPKHCNGCLSPALPEPLSRHNLMLHGVLESTYLYYDISNSEQPSVRHPYISVLPTYKRPVTAL